MSECHKTTTGYSRDSGNGYDARNFCWSCERDLRMDSREWCRFCVPKHAKTNLFKVRLPVQTLDLIKQKHGNVSAYVRGLIAKDLGAHVFPASAMLRPGGGKLKVKTDL
jgi:hypothetical protein